MRMVVEVEAELSGRTLAGTERVDRALAPLLRSGESRSSPESKEVA